jgi:hypothetical protein
MMKLLHQENFPELCVNCDQNDICLDVVHQHTTIQETCFIATLNAHIVRKRSIDFFHSYSTYIRMKKVSLSC